MKINKYWIVIILILVVGFWSTSFTKRYREQLPQAAQEAVLESGTVSDASGSSASTTTTLAGNFSAIGRTMITEKRTGIGAGAADAGYGEAAAEEVHTEPGSDGEDEAAEMEYKQDVLNGAVATDADAVGEENMAAAVQAPFPKAVMEYSRGDAADSTTVQQSATTRTQSVSVDAARTESSEQSDTAKQTETVRTNAYLNRLQDLDAQLEKGRSASTDTTNSLKAASEQELRLWETELDRILAALEKRLSDEETEALFKEQKEWFRDRENTAVDVSKRKSGSTLEEVEYNVSLADSTRARAYELAEQYADILTEAE